MNDTSLDLLTREEVKRLSVCAGKKIVSKKTSKERKLQIVLGVLSLIVIGLIVANVLFRVELSAVCFTKECVTAAGAMIKSMDMSADPCKNFYQFACGSWIKDNPPHSGYSWTHFDALRNQLNVKIKEILERKINDEDPKPLNIAKKLYASCLTRNNTSYQDLSDFVKMLLNEDELKPKELGKKLGELRRIGDANYIVGLSVGLDEENKTRHRVYIDQPSFELDRINLVQESPEHEHKTAYIELIEEIWSEVYPNVSNKAEIAKEIVEFETKLANISTKEEDREDTKKLYNPMTLKELSNLTSDATMIDWERFFEATFKGVQGLGDLKELRVIVLDIEYFTAFGTLLKETIEKREDILWNYLKWRIIYDYSYQVNSKMRDIHFKYNRKVSGSLVETDMQEECLNIVHYRFGMAISYHYVQDVLSSNFQEQMTEMIENIREAFYDIINEIEWFGEPSTRIKAKQKAEKMRTFIGYPKWLLNKTNDYESLRKKYDDLPEEMSDSHFNNMVEILKWENLKNLKDISRPMEKSRWITTPTVAHWYYSSYYNSIAFPAGVLQPPFYFTGKTIQALNYGAIGMLIGHEITHGFDEARGRQRDGDGDLVDWWDEETVNQYKKRAECFVGQYGNYSEEEADNMQLNGNKTLDENIADNGGLRQAFRAYQSFVQKNGPEPRLPGLDYSPEQLFFIAFSQIWCGAFTKEGMKHRISTGWVSPNRFRVKGALDNFHEFAEVWNCPRPEEKSVCRIW